MQRWRVEEDRERKVLLLLVFGEGRKMWNEDNKEGNYWQMLEIRWTEFDERNAWTGIGF